jgi:molybdopterin-containing oxidoreductase family iron-sulfur binding subunit
MPAWILPGQADGSIALEIGYGRTEAGRVGAGVGHNVNGLRTSDAMGFAAGVEVSRTGATYELVSAQEHHSMEGRPLVREATLEHYREEPEFAKHAVHHPPLESLYENPVLDDNNQWGMAIDLTTCTGCNACVVACQAENNIPIVGKEEVARGREMHWLRMDRYFSGDEGDPQAVVQPVACQHCEHAPCENVCPVAATVHSPDGLNVMTYNRCVGTRYCSNNCPYKVRRFNFFNWHGEVPEVKKMVFNPDVTVRMRGVMEKCTYCLQRIQEKKIAAKADGRREIADGEVVTACQQTCPAESIVFGNIADPESRVSKVKARNRDYAMLEELNIKPRTTYLARLRNPNPELEPSGGGDHGGGHGGDHARDNSPFRILTEVKG